MRKEFETLLGKELICEVQLELKRLYIFSQQDCLSLKPTQEITAQSTNYNNRTNHLSIHPLIPTQKITATFCTAFNRHHQ